MRHAALIASSTFLGISIGLTLGLRMALLLGAMAMWIPLLFSYALRKT